MKISKLILGTVLITSFLISCSGEDGEQGPQGELGLQGEQGPQGEAGQDGNANVSNLIVDVSFIDVAANLYYISC